MLATSPTPEAEEYAIHDYEGFGGIRISENEGTEGIAQIVAFMTEQGALGAAVLNYYCGDINDARAAIKDRYLGSYASLADYIEEVTEETVSIPQPLRYYIDWQAMARDAEINGDLFAIEQAHHEVHVFAGG